MAYTNSCIGRPLWNRIWIGFDFLNSYRKSVLLESSSLVYRNNSNLNGRPRSFKTFWGLKNFFNLLSKPWLFIDSILNNFFTFDSFPEIVSILWRPHIDAKSYQAISTQVQNSWRYIMSKTWSKVEFCRFEVQPWITCWFLIFFYRSFQPFEEHICELKLLKLSQPKLKTHWDSSSQKLWLSYRNCPP
jgi:hypothetical protein